MAVAVSELTLAELRLKYAQLKLSAETERDRWRGMVPTHPSAAASGRRVRALDARVQDYEMILAGLVPQQENG